MEYLNIFIKRVHQFYKEVVEVEENVFENFIKKSVKPCSSITNQCLILDSLIKEESSLEGTGLEILPNFKDLLIDSVLNSVKKELDDLISLRDDTANIVSCLCKKYELLDESFKQLKRNNFDYMQILNPITPRLEYIVDWSLDIWRYYHSLHLQITIALENLNFEDRATVTALIEAFKEDRNLKENVNRIRGFEFESFPFIE